MVADHLAQGPHPLLERLGQGLDLLALVGLLLLRVLHPVLVGELAAPGPFLLGGEEGGCFQRSDHLDESLVQISYFATLSNDT